jgi:bifunctional non-homologous end joining protein LigD
MITPMIARPVKVPFDRDGWYFELKWDGFRAIAEKDRQGVRLYSRNQNDFKKRFSVIAEAVSALDNVILDGEVCALDDHGHPRFEWLINRGRQRGKLVYYVFDLLRLGDKDLRSEPLFRRKKLLAKLLKHLGPARPAKSRCVTQGASVSLQKWKNDTLRYVDHVENDGLPIFAGALALGLEGIIAKDKNSRYIEGPTETWYWQKIKNERYKRHEKIEFRRGKSSNAE